MSQVELPGLAKDSATEDGGSEASLSEAEEARKRKFQMCWTQCL